MQAVKDPEVLRVLQGVKCDGCVAVLTSGQLEPQLYKKVDAVLKALGGKWNRGRGGHIFPGGAEEILATVLSDGTYHDVKKDDGFFETPVEIVQRMLFVAGIEKGMHVLEPSAGKGAIVRALVAAGANVVAYEKNPAYKNDLHAAGVSSIVIGDFLEQPVSEIFDAVVMNPPFSAGHKQVDILHVAHAFAHLRPGGVLSAITSLSWTFRDNKASRGFKQLVGANRGIWVELPAGTFKGSGTDVAALHLTMRRSERGEACTS